MAGFRGWKYHICFNVLVSKKEGGGIFGGGKIKRRENGEMGKLRGGKMKGRENEEVRK